jgi:hypothetical protein
MLESKCAGSAATACSYLYRLHAAHSCRVSCHNCTANRCVSVTKTRLSQAMQFGRVRQS